MSIKDSHNRRVSFDTKEELGDKIDKLAVMIGKLATRQIKPQIYQGKGRGKIEVIMIDSIIVSGDIRTDVGQIVKIGDCIDRIKVGIGMNKIIGEVILEVMRGILTDKIAEEYILAEMKVMTEV